MKFSKEEILNKNSLIKFELNLKMKFSKEEILSKNHSGSYSDLPSSLKEKFEIAEEETDFFTSNMFFNNNNGKLMPKNYYYHHNNDDKEKNDLNREMMNRFKITLENIKEENSDLETSRDDKAFLFKIRTSQNFQNYQQSSKIFDTQNKNIFKKILNTVCENNKKNKIIDLDEKDKIVKKLNFKKEEICKKSKKQNEKENLKIDNSSKNVKSKKKLNLTNSKKKKFLYLSPPFLKNKNLSRENNLKLRAKNFKKFSSGKSFLDNFSYSDNKDFHQVPKIKIDDIFKNKILCTMKTDLQKNENFLINTKSIKNLKENRKKLFRKMKNCSLKSFQKNSISLTNQISINSNGDKFKKDTFYKNIYLKEFNLFQNILPKNSLSIIKKSPNNKSKSKKNFLNFKLNNEKSKINFNNIENIYHHNKTKEKKNKSNKIKVSYKKLKNDLKYKFCENSKNLAVSVNNKKFYKQSVEKKTEKSNKIKSHYYKNFQKRNSSSKNKIKIFTVPNNVTTFHRILEKIKKNKFRNI